MNTIVIILCDEYLPGGMKIGSSWSSLKRFDDFCDLALGMKA